MDSPEQQLQAFLNSLPEWRRKWLKHEAPFDPDWISQKSAKASREEIAVAKEQLTAWAGNLDQDITIRERYEALLRPIPSRWREYREKMKRIALSDLPKSKPGRKSKTELAERIWQLFEGSTSIEIHQKLKSEGATYSLEAIESYLKTRRRKQRK